MSDVREMLGDIIRSTLDVEALIGALSSRLTDMQTRRALMSLLRRGQVSLSGAKRVSWKGGDGAARPH